MLGDSGGHGAGQLPRRLMNVSGQPLVSSWPYPRACGPRAIITVSISVATDPIPALSPHPAGAQNLTVRIMNVQNGFPSGKTIWPPSQGQSQEVTGISPPLPF